MTTPPRVTIRNLTGTWIIDKSRTENLDAALKLQGIGWLRRKAVSTGTITLKITQYSDPDPDSSTSTSPSTSPPNTDTVKGEKAKAVRLMMQQGLRGIFPGVEQTRVLDWSEHGHVDAVSGAGIVIRSRFVDGIRIRNGDGDGQGTGMVKPEIQVQTVGAVDLSSVEGYLGGAVCLLNEDHGGGLERMFVQDFIRCEEGGWTAEQVWAVEKVGEDVFLSCRAVAVKGSSLEKACLVYKYEEQQ
ncbi:hypothetical protein BJX70DRAFT_397309 [Aspergillus crustosus]